jgi:hypothetical protein
MAKEFVFDTATKEFTVEPDWKPFPSTAPKDRKIIVFGRWKRNTGFPGGGDPACYMAQWGSYSSNPRDIEKDSDWMGDGIGGPIMRHNVDWTHWMELPAEPKT